MVEYVEIPVQKIAARVDIKPKHWRRMEESRLTIQTTRTWRAAERLLMIRLTRQLRRLGIQPMGPIEVAWHSHVVRMGGILVAYQRGIAWPGPLPDDLARWVPGDRASVIVPREALREP